MYRIDVLSMLFDVVVGCGRCAGARRSATRITTPFSTLGMLSTLLLPIHTFNIQSLMLFYRNTKWLITTTYVEREMGESARACLFFLLLVVFFFFGQRFGDFCCSAVVDSDYVAVFIDCLTLRYYYCLGVCCPRIDNLQLIRGEYRNIVFVFFFCCSARPQNASALPHCRVFIITHQLKLTLPIILSIRQWIAC
jgi:hypothetical protein